MAANIESRKCITPEFRVSFPNVFKARAFQDQEAKYSLVMLFPKKTDLTALKKAAAAAATEKWGAKEKWPKNLRLPFRDGNDKPDTQGYEDCIFVSASNKHRPGLVDNKLQAIIDEEGFYAGCYARAEVIAFAYDTKGNKGVSFSLSNIQKLRDGEPFSGRKAAEDVFESVDDGSDDEAAYGTSGKADDDDDDLSAFM